MILKINRCIKFLKDTTPLLYYERDSANNQSLVSFDDTFSQMFLLITQLLLVPFQWKWREILSNEVSFFYDEHCVGSKTFALFRNSVISVRVVKCEKQRVFHHPKVSSNDFIAFFKFARVW